MATKKAKAKVGGAGQAGSKVRAKKGGGVPVARKTARVKREKVPVGSIVAWEDDPMSGGAPIVRPAPNLSAGSFAIRITTPAPPVKEYKPGTSQFRYWTAAEALARAAGMWSVLVPATRWQPGGVLPVVLDFGVDLNAYYDREGLKFFHAAAGGKIVYSGESPDVLCHELGHAVLDSVRPDLWDANSDEVAAFHESFGDMSALLSQLQLPSFRKTVLTETGGSLYRSSRLSRLAEQLGWAIRLGRPDAVDPDSLRNAVNSFFYRDPMLLAPSGPANVLTSEPHSFSRVFTAAFFEGLANMLGSVDPTKGASADQLGQVAHDAGSLLVEGVRHAPLAASFYSKVAGAMVAADAAGFGGKYAQALKSAFIRHGILSLDSASSLTGPQAVGIAQSFAASRTAAAPLAPVSMNLDGGRFGLAGRTLVCQVASHSQTPAAARAITSAATPGFAAAADAPAMVGYDHQAAESFVVDLFRRGRVSVGPLTTPETSIEHPMHHKTHQVVERNGDLELLRIQFDCGFNG